MFAAMWSEQFQGSDPCDRSSLLNPSSPDSLLPNDALKPKRPIHRTASHQFLRLTAFAEILGQEAKSFEDRFQDLQLVCPVMSSGGLRAMETRPVNPKP